MEAIELNTGGEIREFVAARMQGLVDSFSVLTVGHITKFSEPIGRRTGISEALELFAAREDIGSLPVEGDRGVIGIVHRKDLLQKKTALMAVTDPPVERFLDASAYSVDASENCEKAMGLILERDPARLYDDFMIFERGKFFGIGSFADLSRNIAAIRALDLGKARSMQEFLMARNAISGPGIACERYVRMAHEIGGDYLQCMDIREGLSLLSCFDVCGKGTAAALFTSILSSFFSTLKVRGSLPSLSPLSILQALNGVVMDQTPEELFIAGAMAFVDREHGELTVFNCGFPPLYAFYADEESGKPKGRIVNPGIWPLGINEYADPRGSAFPLQKGMRLFMHTDGLTDARNERGERYEEDRLRQFLYPRCMRGAKALVAELKEEISGFIGSAPLADDITALAAEIA
jgi:serine phosphatase RsbU (regulator of sigma subunit)